MPMDQMGVLNRGWGICGFTSSLYALYNHNPAQQARLAGSASVTTRMLAEIKTFLRVLQAEGPHDVLQNIETFTKTFPGYQDFTIETYIARINNIVMLSDEQLDELRRDTAFSIGLQPLAVVEYLRKMCGFRGAGIVQSDRHELILGLCGTQMRLYDGLEHYVYSLNGTIYSWGRRFNSVEEAATTAKKTWTVGYRIALA